MVAVWRHGYALLQQTRRRDRGDCEWPQEETERGRYDLCSVVPACRCNSSSMGLTRWHSMRSVASVLTLARRVAECPCAHNTHVTFAGNTLFHNAPHNTRGTLAGNTLFHNAPHNTRGTLASNTPFHNAPQNTRVTLASNTPFHNAPQNTRVTLAGNTPFHNAPQNTRVTLSSYPPVHRLRICMCERDLTIPTCRLSLAWKQQILEACGVLKWFRNVDRRAVTNCSDRWTCVYICDGNGGFMRNGWPRMWWSVRIANAWFACRVDLDSLAVLGDLLLALRLATVCTEAHRTTLRSCRKEAINTRPVIASCFGSVPLWFCLGDGHIVHTETLFCDFVNTLTSPGRGRTKVEPNRSTI